MPIYLRPSTLNDALSQLRAGSYRLLAGGTDIYPATQRADLAEDIIDLTSLSELCGIHNMPDGIRIGACTPWSMIARAKLPPALCALQQAAAEVGGKQIQNAGTIGGNLCNASPAADGVPPLLVLDAQVELARAGRIRKLPLADFLLGPRQTALARDEVMTAILLPGSALTGHSRFLKLGARAYLVISIAMVAVRLTTEHGRITSAALAIGACSATAQRLPLAESALIGAALFGAAELVTAEIVAPYLSPLDDIRASADYRAEAAVELLRRAISQTGRDRV
ncbi:xanthine dehydrogenase family protein subunit M [Pseudorhodobacter sp.]|uniref:FAD binding domain-containing protein n=1 Tax=Pseudorhodobacter sp. TaxID=1934400 RepID=UPI0026475716|nr:FAD binding domain-containing protein [Pseudorhodobacter sp.]MDN5786753.1 FAD binding domain-containing protein [Pseudorhodobacter sp.]